MKKLLGIVLAICMMLSMLPMTALAELDNETMFRYIIDEFTAIAAIPRGSGNTDAISDYLKGWGL